MSIDGVGYDGDSEGGSPLSLWGRLSSAGRSAPRRVVSGATAFGTGTKDAFETMRDNWHRSVTKMDKWAANGMVGRIFAFKQRGAKASTEMRAGFITFLMVSYILAVNPSILATTGGTCNPQEVCTAESLDVYGPQCLVSSGDPAATRCMTDLTRSLITATASSSLISTFFIGHFGNLPLALAPGIGINAYVAYQVVGQYGSGSLTYQQAMAAIFIEGWIFLLLSVTGVRGGIVKFMPKSIAMASSVGIGMLLAFTGLRSMGVITFDSATLVSLGGCPANHRNYLYAFDQQLNETSLAALDMSSLPPPASVYGCVSQNMRSATMWLGISGGFIMCLLLYMGVKGSLIIGIAFVTIISWIPGHGASYLGASSPIPGGEARMDFFKQVVAAPTLDATGLAWDWSAFGSGKLWVALFTFLYIDLLDCTGTLLSMARLLDYSMPGFLSDTLEFPGQMWAFLSDGIGIVTGSMMGTTPLTVYIESAAGIEDGGRTGLTAVVVSFFFLVSLFFSPILASIPPYATGPALVLVGTILLGHIAHIEWDDIGVAIPAFLTMTLMPFTYSVAYGVIAGLVSYLAIHLPFWVADWARRRWGKGEGPDGVRVKRVSRQSGYQHRKTFVGPGEGPPSRADSYVGDPRYQDSYHSTDSRRSGLPIIAMVGGGGPGAGLGIAPGPVAGSIQGGSIAGGRSAPPSVANLYYPDSSQHRPVPARTGSYGMSADGEVQTFVPPLPSGLALFRKSHSLHSPGRGADMLASSAAVNAVAFGHQSRPVPSVRPGVRGMTDSGAAVYSTSPVRHGLGSSGGASPAAVGVYRAGALTRQSSLGGLARVSSPQTLQRGGAPLGPGGRALFARSRTFSHGLAHLGQGDDIHLDRTTSSSEHGGNLYKQYNQEKQRQQQRGRQGQMAAAAAADTSFKLFGDIEPLPLSMSGGVDDDAAGAGPTSSREELGAEKSFRLFGDVEPMALSMSGTFGEEPSLDVGGGVSQAAGAPPSGPSRAQQEEGGAEEAEDKPFRLFGDVLPLPDLRATMEVEWHDGGEWRYQHHASTHHTASEEQGIPNMPSLTLQQTALSDSDRTATADLSFGSPGDRPGPLGRGGSGASEQHMYSNRAFSGGLEATQEDSAPPSAEGSARGGRLALAALAVRGNLAGRSSSWQSEEGPLTAAVAEQDAQEAAAAAARGEPHQQQQSTDEQRAQEEQAYEEIATKLGSGRRGRSMARLAAADAGGTGSGERGFSRSSSQSTVSGVPRVPMRSSSLALAAQQLAMLQRLEEPEDAAGGSGDSRRAATSPGGREPADGLCGGSPPLPLSPSEVSSPQLPPSPFGAPPPQHPHPPRPGLPRPPQPQARPQQPSQLQPSPFDSAAPLAAPLQRYSQSLPVDASPLPAGSPTASTRELRQTASAGHTQQMGSAPSFLSGVMDLEEPE